MTTDHPSVNVWLVEDNAVYRRTVASVIDQAEGMHCPREFGSCEDALAELASGPRPDVILLDVGLPGMNGIDGIGQIKSLAPAAQILVLTVFEDDDKIFRAVCAGASGYLLKVSPIEEIVAAVEVAGRGGSPINARIARRVLEMFSSLAPAKHDYGLTAREKEILELLIQGFIKKEIARRLDLSVHTVDSHIRNIYDKLHVNTRGSAVAKAIKERLV